MVAFSKTLYTQRGAAQAGGCSLPMAGAVIIVNVFKQNYGGKGDGRVLGAN